MNTKLSYEVLPTASIRAFAKNPRHHGKQQVNRIAASIREFGFTNPVLVDEHMELIAGHGRHAAALLEGLTSIPAIIVSGLSSAQKKALRIADNRIAEQSTWSAELLAGELKDLLSLDFDIELTGFDSIELDGLLTGDAEGAEEEPPIGAPPATPVSRIGDLWGLGGHRLFCGDACLHSSYQAVLDGRVVDMVITDVPYNVPIAGNVSGLGRNKHGEFAMASGEMSTEQFREFLRITLGLARDASRDGSLHYVFIDWRSVADLVVLGRELFSELKNIVAWVKPNGGMGAFYRSQHELIAVFKHGHGRHVNNVQLGRLGRYRSNVWQYPGASGFSSSRAKDLEDHPTVKPVRLVADAIRDATSPGDLVLDPFGGAGTTLLAAEQVGRHAALIEIEPRYVDVTLRRFAEQANAEPVLLPERVPLSEVRRERLGQGEQCHVG
jgi:DNA modification methylase